MTKNKYGFKVSLVLAFLFGGIHMDWTLYILMAMWATTLAFELRMIIKKRRADKANYRFMVCEQRGENLVPIDVFESKRDAINHHIYQSNIIVVRITSSDLRWYEKHVSD